jgi:hypothetical protein
LTSRSLRYRRAATIVFGSIPASRKTTFSDCERRGVSVWTLAAAPGVATRRVTAKVAMAVTAEHTRLIQVLAGLEGAVRGICVGHRRPGRIASERERCMDG